MGVDLERYSRQILFDKIGEAGQEKLAGGAVLVVGCGALGAAVASLLVRAGVGTVRLVDRDVVEASNLHGATTSQRSSGPSNGDSSKGTPHCSPRPPLSVRATEPNDPGTAVRPCRAPSHG